MLLANFSRLSKKLNLNPGIYPDNPTIMKHSLPEAPEGEISNK